MADSSKILLSGEENSEQIKIDPSVLEVILGIAAEKVDGVAGMRGSLRSGLNWVLGREDHGKGVNVKVDEDNKLVADVYGNGKYFTFDYEKISGDIFGVILKEAIA